MAADPVDPADAAPARGRDSARLPAEGPRPLSALAFAGRLLVRAGLARGAVPDAVSLSRGDERPCRCRVLGVVPIQGEGGDLLVAVDLLDTLPFRLFAGPVTIGLLRGEEALASGKASVGRLRLDDAGSDPRAADEARAAAGAGLLPPEAAALTDPAFDWRQSAVPFHYAIDVVNRSRTGLGIAGWFGNAGSARLVALSEDGVGFAGPGAVWRSRRPDVSAHLRSQGHPVGTDVHGIMFALTHTGPGCEAFRLVDLAAVPPRVHGPLPIPGDGPPNAFVDAAWAFLGQGAMPPPQVSREVFLPFFAEPRSKPRWRAVTFKKAREPVRCSIVVPFYKDAGFVRSIVMMQNWFPPDVEWVLVCDDPGIFGELVAYLTGRSEFLKNQTVFVHNEENYGYSTANNIGVEVAQGDVVVLMNSDVWAESASPFMEAAELLRSGAWDVLGMRLLYEDGTVQHDGMAFKSYPFMRGLFVADHPGKGLPPRPVAAGAAPREVPAVTGALLMMTKAFYEELGGLDEGYIKGDFEDADLCLRARHRGGRVGVLPTGEVYHLERHSIRLMADGGARAAITYLNCISFNQAWGDHLRRDPQPASTPPG